MKSRQISEAAQLRQWDCAHVWHPFTAMSAYEQEQAPIIERAERFHVVDIAGRRYLDGISSLWCNVHGHCVPEIDSAIRAQLDRVAHTTLLGLSSVPSIELARRLAMLAPAGLTRVFFSDSGATAVEAALKIAYQYHQQKPGGGEPRDLFATVGGAYHGDTIGAVSVGSLPLFHERYGGLLFDTVRVPSPGSYRRPAGMDVAAYHEFCLHELERIITGFAGRLAAFVIEPIVQGAAGILVHPPGYLTRVRTLTAEHDIPLIADEVAVGFGRTGTLFACEHEQVGPDLLCLAKGLTGGYLPVAATLATDRIYEAFLGEPALGRTFFHGHTYTGNALGCAAALASLDLLERGDVLGLVRRNAGRIRQRLAGLTGHPHVGEVRQKGLMVGIELVRDPATTEPFAPELRMGHRVTVAARDRGVIIRPLGDVVVLMPAPAMPPELIDELTGVVCESIDTAISSAQ